METQRHTEQNSNYDNLEQMSTEELLTGINNEDESVANSIKKQLPKISNFIDAAYKKMADGGRLFYMGAGTSGRLGIVDASECPPTFGVDHGVVVGIMAGGDLAIRKAVEFAEDDTEQGWKDLEKYNICQKDTVIGIAASGSTPYVIGAMKKCVSNNILTAGITCNENSGLADAVDHPLEIVVGPEFVTGSTRMKAGTAQKLVLNMISTAIMIKLGHVKGNKMVDMQLSNNKLVDRGTKMVCSQLGVEYEEGKTLLLKYGSVRKAVASKG
ncbi:MAG: N-acetylmuramic acid 6-phosphate etherase [Patiriisocius sp.]